MRIVLSGVLAAFLLSTSAYAEERLAEAKPSTEAQSPEQSAKPSMTDLQVIAAIIAASREAYFSGSAGPCACPEDKARNGSRCGKRSAYVREGGWSVTCYAKDVSAEMIQGYRASLK